MNTIRHTLYPERPDEQKMEEAWEMTRSRFLIVPGVNFWLKTVHDSKIFICLKVANIDWLRDR